MFAARQSGKYEVISSAPSVNLTQMGNAVVPVPYPVSIKLTPSDTVVPYVFFNGKKVYVKRSTTTEVKGDEKGSKKGIVSGTVNGEAIAIVYAPTVKVDGSNLVRVGDMYKMQGGNTVGKLTTTEDGKGGSIGAEGDVVGPCSPPDLSGTQGSDAWSSAMNMLKDPSSLMAKAQDLKSKYDTVAGMINGDIPFSAGALAGIAGGLTGNQSLMQASSMLNKAQTAKKMLSGEIPFSPAMAMGLAGSATGNPGMAAAAQSLGMVEGVYNKVDKVYEGQGKTPLSNPYAPAAKVLDSKPSASALSKMIKSDTVQNFGKTLLGAMSSKEKPTLSTAKSGLGSLMGSPVLLATAQSIQRYALPPLLGAMPIDFTITYVSDLFYQGAFGKERRHSYEKQFYQLRENSYRLDLADGRWFQFIKQEDGSFKDLGSLGVKVTQIDAQSFELYYLKTALTEHYHNNYLRRIEDPNQNSITLSYQATKNPKVERLEKIENSSEASWTFTYNDKELLKTLSDHTGRSWNFRYNKEKYLSQIIFEKESKESYAYTLIERKNLPPQQLLSSVRDLEQQVKLSFTYNQKGEVRGYAQGEQQFTYTWHSLEQIEKTNGSGSSIIYGLDDSKRVSAITYPDGSFTQEQWDSEKNVALFKTRGGATFVKSFDAQGRLLSVLKDEKLVESFAYEADNPKPIAHTQEDQSKEAQTTSYEYDKAFKLIKITTADEAIYTYEYNKEGLMTLSRDALKHETLYAYNPQAMLSQRIDPLGHATNIHYDSLSRVIKVSLANEQEHHYRYNESNQIIAYKNPEHETLSFSYTPSGKLLALKDPAKRITEFSYDEHERVISKTYPYLKEDEKQSEYYTYNPDNTVATITRVDGTRLYFNYDSNQNISKILADNNQGEVESLEYTYDKLSNLSKAMANQNSLLLDYDENLSLSHQKQNGIEVQSIYEEKSEQLNSLTFLDQTLSYSYDEANNLSAVINNQEQSIKLTYDKNKVLSQRTYPNRTKETLTYDEAYNLTTIEAKDTHIRYHYNEVGEAYLKKNAKDEDAKLYRYNGRGELIQAQREDFAYSTAGNRIEEGWEYNYKNQLTQTPKYLYSYDARGNLSSKSNQETKEETKYSFNLFNQLTEVQRVDENQEIVETFNYAYDALNRRVSKACTSTKLSEQSYKHHYLYDQHNIIAILDQNKALLASIVHDDTMDTPLSITTHQNTLRELTEVEESYYHELNREDKAFIDKKRRQRSYYYNRDHQGSIHTLTNEKGEVVESFRYDDSYGRILEHTKTEETLNPYCYTGREFETEELYYYRARYYDPSVGRFISSDPIEFLAGDFNFYRYVGNSPVGWVDPFGLARCDDKTRKERQKKISNTKGYNTIKLGFKKKAKAQAVASKRGGSTLGFDALRRGFLEEMTLNLTARFMGGIYTSPEELEKEKANEAKCEEKAEKKKDKKDAKDGNKAVKGDANEAQCKKKAGKKQGSDDFHGGQHKILKKGGDAVGRESHHMPADSTYTRLNGGSVSYDNKPAIQMTKEDHKLTASHGKKKAAEEHRYRQSALILRGKQGFKAAMMMDIADIRKKFGSKYNGAIIEMIAWAKCMKYM